MRRRLLIAATFLLAGAVVNVAVAWGCLTWSMTEQAIASRTLRDDERLWWRRHAPSGFEGTVTAGYRLDGFGLTGITRGAPAIRSDRAVVPYWIIAQELRAGWPARTVSGQRWTRSPGLFGIAVDESKTVCRWSWSLGPAILSTAEVHEWRLFPLGPLWVGLIVNTLFYAGILGLLIPGPFVLRRIVRVKRGLCPKCAYPMGETAVCSECGQAVANLARRVRCQVNVHHSGAGARRT